MKKEEFVEFIAKKYSDSPVVALVAGDIFTDIIRPLNNYIEKQANLPAFAPSLTMIDVRTEAIEVLNKVWRERKKFTLAEAIAEFGFDVPLVSQKTFEPLILEYFVPKFISGKGIVVGEDEVGSVHEFTNDSVGWEIYRSKTKEKKDDVTKASELNSQTRR